MTANPRPSTSDPIAVAYSAAATSGPLSRRLGSSPMSMGPRPNIPTVPSRVIADVAAEPKPTAWALNSFAATAQYTNPSADATPTVPTRLVALDRSALFRSTAVAITSRIERFGSADSAPPLEKFSPLEAFSNSEGNRILLTVTPGDHSQVRAHLVCVSAKWPQCSAHSLPRAHSPLPLGESHPSSRRDKGTRQVCTLIASLSGNHHTRYQLHWNQHIYYFQPSRNHVSLHCAPCATDAFPAGHHSRQLST